ncbi:hypothetical protein ACNUDN_11840 [Mycobacterium sp. smrl_JER01]
MIGIGWPSSTVPADILARLLDAVERGEIEATAPERARLAALVATLHEL